VRNITAAIWGVGAMAPCDFGCLPFVKKKNQDTLIEQSVTNEESMNQFMAINKDSESIEQSIL